MYYTTSFRSKDSGGGRGATPPDLAHGGFALQIDYMPTTLIARRRVGGAGATLFLWLLGGE